MKNYEKVNIKALHGYGFPLWAVKTALKVNGGNADKALKLLEETYEKMSPEEKRTFIQLTLHDKDHTEIMDALERQGSKLDEVRNGQNWAKAYGSDLLANFTSAGILWLGSKLLNFK